MSAVQAERTPEEATAITQGVENELREFVRRDVVSMRRPRRESAPEVGPENVTALLERVAGNSVQEVEKLIGELQAVRDYLHAEGERVQRELASYAHVSQTALASVKIITDSMGQWKSAARR